MSTSKRAQDAAAEALRRFKAISPETWEAIQDEVYKEYGVTRRRRLSAQERAAREAAEVERQAKAKILAIATKAGVRVQFTVESAEDAAANVEILQATAPDEDAEMAAARERYAATVAETGPLQVF
jgi:transcriptional regulator